MVCMTYKVSFPTGKTVMHTDKFNELEDAYAKVEYYRSRGCGIKIITVVENRL